MRSREEIEKHANRDGWGYSAEAILETLLDIRDLLAKDKKDELLDTKN